MWCVFEGGMVYVCVVGGRKGWMRSPSTPLAQIKCKAVWPDVNSLGKKGNLLPKILYKGGIHLIMSFSLSVGCVEVK